MEHGELSQLEQNVKFLKDVQFNSEKEIDEYQNEKFLRVVKRAYEVSPFYKSLYDSKGVDINEIQSLDDIEKLPTVDKEMMRGMDLSYIDGLGQDISYMTTGGSTGNPFKIFMDESFRSLNHANTYFYLSIAGFEISKTKNVRLHGDLFDEKQISKGETYRVQNDRTLVLSSNHISEENARIYLEQINEFKPDYIHAFPSALSLFSNYIEKLGLKIEVPIKAIFSDCECLYEHQKKQFERLFKCKIFNVYGHTEGSVFGVNCPESDIIHINPFVGHFELIGEDGKPVTKEGERGEIVVTGFNNLIMPFIRYKTGDIGIHTNDKCTCGRNWKFIRNVEGRKQDYVIDNTKTVVPLAPTLFDYNIDWTGVDRFQVIQDKPGFLDVNIILDSNSQLNNEKFEQKLSETFERYFGKRFEIKVTIVDEIQFTHRGKYRYLKQNLDIDSYWN